MDGKRFDPTDPDSEAGPPSPEEEDFASLLAQQEARRPDPRPGQQVTGTIVQIGETESFVDCGTRSELPIATSELQDAEGKLTRAVGDQITAWVQEVGRERRLTMAIEAARLGLDELRRAQGEGTPVSGVVRETNKGGFGVELGGHRAFCPFSQMDLRRVEEPEAWLGRRLAFRVMDLDPRGRNIVLSRRALLQEEREALAARTRADLSLGDIREGTVTRLMPFGAFVDLGGVEGLVHVSQLAHERVSDPAAILRVGQQVRVLVTELQGLGQGRHERIGLSIKALAADPWPETLAGLRIGDEAAGRVARLVDFGAFVTLAPGVEGLVHISELTSGRVRHPSEVVREGQAVTVRILDIDPQRRRISLSLKDAAAPED